MNCGQQRSTLAMEAGTQLPMNVCTADITVQTQACCSIVLLNRHTNGAVRANTPALRIPESGGLQPTWQA
jgi:hypothetical protein